MDVVEVPIRIALSDREVSAAQACGVTNTEYARRKVIQMSTGVIGGVFLHPTGASNFEVKEFSS